MENHRLVAVAGFDMIQADQRERQLGRRRELDPELALGAHRLGAGQLGQPLHPRLRLLGLGGLGLEAVDEALQVGALGLLLVVGNLLLAQLLGALALEVGIAAHVQLGPAAVQVQGMGGDVVQELAVMRDQQQGARVLEQPLLQPEHRIQVQVVGRLVQQQQVRGHHQRPGQVQAHAPAAGERGHRATMGLGRKAQAMQQAAGAGLGVVAVELGQLLVGGGHRLPVFAGVGVGLLAHRRSQHFVATEHELQRRVRQRGGFLGHRGDPHLARQIQIALVGFQLALDGGEQAGLAGAVAADHADPVAGVQGQVDVGQQQPFATAQGEITQGNHGGL